MKQLLINNSPILDIAVLFDSSSKEINHCIIKNHFKENVLHGIFSGKVVNVVDAIDGAFVDIGLAQNAFIRKNELCKSLDINPSHGLLSSLVTLGTHVIVQVNKEPYQSKGAQLSGDISITGKNVVLLPKAKGIKFSKKINPSYDKTTLENAILSSGIENYGLIIRSEIENKTIKEVTEEISDLIKQWDKILHQSNLSQKVRCLYEATQFYTMISAEIEFKGLDLCIVTSAEAVEFLKSHGVDPKKIKRIEPKTNLWQEQHVPIEKILLDKVFSCDSGVSVTLEETEALTVADVNSSKFISTHRKDETALQVNLIAAQRLSQLVRLKNISGMIIIDFIQMPANYEKSLHEKLLKDFFTKEMGFTVLGFSQMGLFEIIRKRERPSLHNLLCNNFNEKDLLYWQVYQLYNELNRIANHTNTKKIEIQVPIDMYQFLRQNDILNAIPLDCQLKPLKESNKCFRLQTQGIDKAREI